MDANGTRYHLVQGREDWGACRLGGEGGPLLAERWGDPQPPDGCGPHDDDPDAGLAWDCRRSELRLASRAFLFTQPGADRAPRLADRRGAARDRHGSWYWIAPNGHELLVRSAGSNTVSRFWSAADVPVCADASLPGAFGPVTAAELPAPQQLRGLAITVDNHLVVGTRRPGGLLVFDLFGGGPPSQVIWPVAWEPFDLSPRPSGGVWVLERDSGSGAGPTWIWEIDRQFRVVPPPGPATPTRAPGSGAFTPGPLGENGRDGDRVVTRDDARQHQGSHPVAIEGLPDGTVLVVDSDPATRFSRVWRYGPDAPTSVHLVAPADLERLVQPDDRDAFALRAVDAAVVPRREERGDEPATPDRLFVVAQSGNQSFAFDLTLEPGRFSLRMTATYLPLRLFGGKGLVATDHALPSYDLGDQWLPLVEQRRPVYVESAVLTTPLPAAGDPASARPPFDGRVPDCTWHRLMLDACFPPGTGVLVESRAANDLETLRTAQWQAEPAPYLRPAGSEIPFQPPRTAPRDGTWELLFQRAKGRYLAVRLTVYGTGTTTPRIRAMRAWYPRFSYLEHYLPDVYRDCDESACFLDRYLANMEGIGTGIEDRIAQVQMLFDVRSAPVEALQWLAGWYGLALDPAWDERRRRLLIAHAMTFFQWRGTTRGLELALKLALDECVDERAFDSPNTPPDPAHPRRPESFRIVEAFLRRVGSRVLDVVDPETPVEIAPATDPELLERWRAFLKRRYRQIGALNRAHRRFGAGAWTSFDTVERAGAVDPGGSEPDDWRAFQDEVVTAGGLAHRFTVLLPGRDELASEQQERAALVRRVIAVAKPAHTVFDVAFFWSAFRVGQARLGDDSIIDSRARAAFAMPPLMLNRGGLAQAYLASRNPVDTCDGRQVIGQGNLGGETR